MVVYVRDTLICRRRPDLEIRGLEAVWVEIQTKSKKVLKGGFYRSPNSNTQYFNHTNKSIDRAYNTHFADVIILGDFNNNMLQDNNNKMKELIQVYSMKQLISDPKRFTENSSSLIDLILVRNSPNILTSGVADTFIPGLTRYHCPIIVLMKFLRPQNKAFKRRIWNYNLADFDKYCHVLTNSNLEEKLQQTTDIDQNTKEVTETIIYAADQAIPNRYVTIRPTEHPWITCHIKNLIRKHKRNFRKFKRTTNPLHLEHYKTLRNKVVSEIRKSKKDYFDKLDNLLSSETTDSKLFWKTSKQMLNIGKSNHDIPMLFMNNKCAETDIQKANMLNNYYASQATLDNDNRPLPHFTPVQHHLASISITIQDVKDVLRNLNVNKASGPDLISPRLLKEGAIILSWYLSIIFNRSLEQGYFPTCWKFGNVTPIHKKRR